METWLVLTFCTIHNDHTLARRKFRNKCTQTNTVATVKQKRFSFCDCFPNDFNIPVMDIREDLLNIK